MAKAKATETKNQTRAEKLAALKAQMEKDYGTGSVMGAKDKPHSHEVISTGSLGVNKALGVGGFPKGRIIEIYGPESSGKTTLCLEAIVEAHRADPEAQCAIVDTEHAIDLEYAEMLGVDLNRLDISQPDYGEQALEITDRMVESGLYSIIIVDSVAALVPKSELDGEMGDSNMGKHARLMSQALRKLTAKVNKSGTILIFTNQIRMKIGVMFGSPETTTGGEALKFYASVRMDVRRSISAANSVMDGEVKIGGQTKVKVVKNKVAPPFREATFDILFGTGIDTSGEILDMGVETDVIQKSGTYFNYDGTLLGQGRDKARQFLEDNDGLAAELRDKINAKFKVKVFKGSEEEVAVQEKEVDDATV